MSPNDVKSVETTLRQAGYCSKAIAAAIQYATGFDCVNAWDIGRRALSHILLTDSQLSAGELVPWNFSM